MTPLAPLALFGLLPLTLLLFAMFPPRRALLITSLFAWLFLPVQGYRLPGLPDYTKISALSFSLLIAVLIFDHARLLSFRPRLFDLPMIIWCLGPFASSVSNGLGVYDGAAAVLTQAIFWGLPYVLGRIYFNDPATLRELIIAIFIAGLVYVPLCLYEIRMSPQLHTILYGFHQHSFSQTKRFGGWRPVVFLQHGLAVGAWMSAATLAGLWLWRSGALRRLWGIPTGWHVAVLFVTTILCKSVNGIGMLAMGLGVLFISKWSRTTFLLLALVAVPPLYMTLRASGLWAGGQAISAASMIEQRRADSLRVRLENEEILTAKALQRPLFGWGGWGRSRVLDARGKDVSVTDGLWVIALGKHGLIGLAAMTAAMLLPALLVWRRCPIALWTHPACAAAVVAAVLLALHMADNLFNAMFNPIFVMVAGGLAGLIGTRAPRALTRAAPAPPARQPAVFRSAYAKPQL